MPPKNTCPPAIFVAPSILQLEPTQDSKGKRGRSYEVSVAERIEGLRQSHANKSMLYFMKEALVFQHNRLDIEEMEASPNHDAWQSEAQRQMEAWERGEEAFNEAPQGMYFNPWSTIHIDRKGSIIAAIFGFRVVDRDLRTLKRNFKDWEEFRTYVEKEKLELRNDGIPQPLLKRFQQATHAMLASERVEFRTDLRHSKTLAHRWSKEHYDLDLELFKYKSFVEPRTLLVDDKVRIEALHTLRRRIREAGKRLKLQRTSAAIEYTQPVGVIPFFESWYQKGHKQVHDKPSKSGPMHGTSVTSGTVTEQYHTYSLEIQAFLSGMARAAFPELAAKYRSAYRKVVPASNISPHALFTGHVVVHNMVVHQHRDKSDGHMCAVFHHDNCHGGALVLPQLHAAHGYDAGHVAVFHSQAVYHGVSTWGPSGDVDTDGIPPGRTAHVFTTHKATIENSKKLPDRYAAQTANGMLPIGRFSIGADEKMWECNGPAIVPELSTRVISSSSSPFVQPKGASKFKVANEYEEEQENGSIYDDNGIVYEFVSDGDEDMGMREEDMNSMEEDMAEDMDMSA